jgi:hypothetical protein
LPIAKREQMTATSPRIFLASASAESVALARSILAGLLDSRETLFSRPRNFQLYARWSVFSYCQADLDPPLEEEERRAGQAMEMCLV